MRRGLLVACVCMVLSALASDGRATMTIQLGSGGAEFVAAADEWRFLRGTVTPPPGWTQADFDDSAWEAGPGGFGYGDGDDATVLDDMRGQYVTVYVRKAFVVPQDPLGAGISLVSSLVAIVGVQLVLTESVRDSTSTMTHDPLTNTMCWAHLLSLPFRVGT